MRNVRSMRAEGAHSEKQAERCVILERSEEDLSAPRLLPSHEGERGRGRVQNKKARKSLTYRLFVRLHSGGQ